MVSVLILKKWGKQELSLGDEIRHLRKSPVPEN